MRNFIDRARLTHSSGSESAVGTDAAYMHTMSDVMMSHVWLATHSFSRTVSHTLTDSLCNFCQKKKKHFGCECVRVFVLKWLLSPLSEHRDDDSWHRFCGTKYLWFRKSTCKRPREGRPKDIFIFRIFGRSLKYRFHEFCILNDTLHSQRPSFAVGL